MFEKLLFILTVPLRLLFAALALYLIFLVSGMSHTSGRVATGIFLVGAVIYYLGVLVFAPESGVDWWRGVSALIGYLILFVGFPLAFLAIPFLVYRDCLNLFPLNWHLLGPVKFLAGVGSLILGCVASWLVMQFGHFFIPKAPNMVP